MSLSPERIDFLIDQCDAEGDVLEAAKQSPLRIFFGCILARIDELEGELDRRRLERMGDDL